MSILLDQLRYDHWANQLFIETTFKLSPDQFEHPLRSSFPSVQDTLVHILWAEELWLERWQGRYFVPALEVSNFQTPQRIKKRLEIIYREQIRFIKTILPGKGDQMLGYLNFRGERCEYSLRQMVQHLCVHSVYHRGQLATLLRQLGVEPPAADYLVYVDENQDSSL